MRAGLQARLRAGGEEVTRSGEKGSCVDCLSLQPTHDRQGSRPILVASLVSNVLMAPDGPRRPAG